jgi:AcrR family transcriptional regulator
MSEPSTPPTADPGALLCGGWGTEPDGLSDVARKRRDEIMDAAEAIIAGLGIDKLSLAQIEERAKMSRGQLTYYFPDKKSILLAVYDRMLRRMIQTVMAGGGPKPMTGRAWDCFRHALAGHLELDPANPPEGKRDLFSLLHTFLAQMGHREDYRNKLSEVYRGWRDFIAADIAQSVREPRPVAPEVAAGLFQALMHGLTVQLMVDPRAFDRQAMFDACVRLFAPVFGQDAGGSGEPGLNNGSRSCEG